MRKEKYQFNKRLKVLDTENKKLKDKIKQFHYDETYLEMKESKFKMVVQVKMLEMKARKL